MKIGDKFLKYLQIGRSTAIIPTKLQVDAFSVENQLYVPYKHGCLENASAFTTAYSNEYKPVRGWQLADDHVVFHGVVRKISSGQLFDITPPYYILPFIEDTFNTGIEFKALVEQTADGQGIDLRDGTVGLIPKISVEYYES